MPAFKLFQIFTKMPWCIGVRIMHKGSGKAHEHQDQLLSFYNRLNDPSPDLISISNELLLPLAFPQQGEVPSTTHKPTSSSTSNVSLARRPTLPNQPTHPLSTVFAPVSAYLHLLFTVKYLRFGAKTIFCSLLIQHLAPRAQYGEVSDYTANK